MKLLPQDLEKEIVRIENNLSGIQSMKRILEEVLIYQFREIANRLLLYLLSQNMQMSDFRWWQQYLAVNELSQPAPIKYESETLTAFKEKFKQDLYGQGLTPLRIEDLYDIEVRVIGGYVRLWNDIEINKQLSRVGSSLRLAYFTGSHYMTIAYLRELLEYPFDKKQIDSGFILGKIGRLSTTPFGPVYDFEHELAVSPYLKESGVMGFCHENTVVVRQPVIRLSIAMRRQNEGKENNDSHGPEERTPIDKEEFYPNWLHVFIHETVHASSFGDKRKLASYFKYFWRDNTEHDIRRFTQTPRTFQELQEAFALNFDNPVIEIVDKTLDGNMRNQLQNNKLEDLVDNMVNKNILIRNDDDKIYCPLFDERIYTDN